MFATRDQENLAHAHQTTAAGKPLNQGTRALQPKTPGKTPFRASRNDENNPLAFQGQKTQLKDGPSKLDKNAFVTPAAPRNRAPLGAKTANAKAQNFKTPGPAPQTSKKDKTVNRPSTARRSGRSKIIVAPTEPVEPLVLENDISEDEPDFGYAPPPVPDLPDYPPDCDPNQTYPLFYPEDAFRGYGELFCTSPKDENGMSIRAKREEEEYKKFQERRERDFAQQLKRERTARLAGPDEQVEAMIAAGPQKKSQTTKPTESNLNTLKARSAVTALSEPNSNPRIPSVANKQTASSRARQQQHAPKQSSTTTTTTSTTTSSSRPLHPRPTALHPHPVSKSTIGFPKAKKPPSIIPSGQQLKNKPERVTISSTTNQTDISPRDFVELYGEPPLDSEMWYRLQREERLEQQLKDYTIEEEDDLADEFFKTGLLSSTSRGGGDEDFEFPMPEDEEE